LASGRIEVLVVVSVETSAMSKDAMQHFRTAECSSTRCEHLRTCNTLCLQSCRWRNQVRLKRRYYTTRRHIPEDSNCNAYRSVTPNLLLSLLSALSSTSVPAANYNRHMMQFPHAIFSTLAVPCIIISLK